MQFNNIHDPKFFNNNKIWQQENETIRVRGNIRIPKNVTIPYNLIIEGDLISDCKVSFKGNLKVKGSAIIGARNTLDKSIVCQKELILLDKVRVNNCIDSEERIFIKNLKVGVDPFGGGIASSKTIYLEGVQGQQKVYSKEQIHTVESIENKIPEKLKQIIGVIAS